VDLLMSEFNATLKLHDPMGHSCVL
jgi:hypothetical protein